VILELAEVRVRVFVQVLGMQAFERLIRGNAA